MLVVSGLLILMLVILKEMALIEYQQEKKTNETKRQCSLSFS